MTIQTRRVEYQYNDLTLEGLLAWDDATGTPRPAVAIAHTWAGRSPFEEEKAVALARQGYVGFAIDMYGKGVLGSTPEENSALMTPLMEDRALLQARIGLAVEVLRQQAEVDPARVAAMGFCFGGLCVLDLARSGSDVAGVASFHGLFGAPGNTAGNRITARVLCLHGYDDPMAPPEAMLALAAELSEAGADWQVHAYGGTVHAFTNPAANNPEMGTRYNAAADRRSWVALQDFLREVFA
ncbi:MAG: dienelactone hydrolase family protein [Halieaceae bacterium]|jgi:dienelactone hydrolase|nr:dienelactone hydrolase family protein [Halieaceae bacterium]